MSSQTQQELNNSEHDVAQSHYDNEFNRLTSTPDMRATEDQAEAAARDLDSSRRAAGAAENTPGTTKPPAPSGAEKAAQTALSTAGGAAGKAASYVWAKLRTKTGAGTTAIIAVLLAGLMGLSMLPLAPVAFIRNVMDDLHDPIAALDKRDEKMMRTKIAISDREQFLKGCTKASLRCRYKSFSNRQVERMKKAGIEVKGTKIGTRTFPTSYNYKGESISANKFVEKMSTNTALRLDFRRAANNRVFALSDKTYVKLMERFNISKAAPKLTEDTESEYKKLATGQKSPGLTGDIVAKPTGEKDAKGNDLYTIEGDQTGRRYTMAELDSWKVKFGGIFDSIRGAASITATNLAKAVNIIGYEDMKCSFVNALGQAAVAAKIAKYLRFAQYVMPIAAAVSKINAGRGTEKDGAVIGKFFGDTDVRRTIVDEKASLESGISQAQGNKVNEADFSIATKPNPYFNKNAMDSTLYQASASGLPRNPANETTTKYSLSLSQNKVASALDKIGIVLSFGAFGKTACNFVQNWLVRGVGFVVGVISLFFGVGEVSLAKNLVAAVAITAGFILLGQFLHAITEEKPVDDGIVNRPEDRAAITWTGLSVIASENSRMTGLIPANKSQILAYEKDRQASLAVYHQADALGVSPWDVSSPESAISRVASTVQSLAPPDFTIGSIVNFARSSLSLASKQTISASSAVYPKDSAARFSQCDDQSYNAMGIDADVQCNVRFYMPQEDMDKDPDAVAQWMEDHGYVEKDTVTGVPPGYIPPSAQEMNFGMQLLSGAIESFVNTRDYINDYGKYLDYCVYRAMPYGETYQETGARGAASEEWQTGSICLSHNNEMISYFRAYRADTRAVDISDIPQAEDTTQAGDGKDTSTTDLAALFESSSMRSTPRQDTHPANIALSAPTPPAQAPQPFRPAVIVKSIDHLCTNAVVFRPLALSRCTLVGGKL